MVDVNTIKPGDKVFFLICDGHTVYAEADGIRLQVFDRQEFTVANPPITVDRQSVRISHDYFPSGIFLASLGLCHMGSTQKEYPPCTCDSFKVLMVSGCRCGAMQREREGVQ